MITITDILQDVDRGILANNMVEDKFSYRIIFFVYEGVGSVKRYIDTPYSDLRRSLENIIRGNLSLTNRVVIAETTALKGRKCVRLQSSPYSFSLDGYFRQISGEIGGRNRNGNIAYNRYATR